MPKLPVCSGDDLIRALERLGFVRLRQKGSHVSMKRTGPDGSIGCVVPRHKELAQGTLKAVLKQAGITPEEFVRYWQGH